MDFLQSPNQTIATIIINVTNKTTPKRRQGHKTLKAKNSVPKK